MLAVNSWPELHSHTFIQIMDSSHVDEHAHVAGHMTPGHALQSQDPSFFLSKDAVNFAALTS